MGAFCVYGMTEQLAKKAAERAWQKYKESMTADVRACLRPSDQADWIKVKTDTTWPRAILCSYRHRSMLRSSPASSSNSPRPPAGPPGCASCSAARSSTSTERPVSARPPSDRQSAGFPTNKQQALLRAGRRALYCIGRSSPESPSEPPGLFARIDCSHTRWPPWRSCQSTYSHLHRQPILKSVQAPLIEMHCSHPYERPETRLPNH